MDNSSRVFAFQKTHRFNVPKEAATHFIPNDSALLDKGLINANDDMAAFLRGLAGDIDRAKGRPLSLYEKLPKTLRFFLEFTVVSGVAAAAEEALARRLFQVAGRALRCEGRGEDVFFPGLDLTALRCVALRNGTHLRLVFPDLFVGKGLALALHRHILDRLQAELTPAEKRCLFRDPPATDHAFLVLPLDAWLQVCPGDVYLSKMGVPLCGTCEVLRCPEKVVGKHTANCNREGCVGGYLVNSEPLEVLMALRNATEPKAEEEATLRLRASSEAALRETMLRCPEHGDDAEETQPYMVPTYAPPVPMKHRDNQPDGLLDCFECERSTFGPSKATATRRQEYDPRSRDFAVLAAMTATQAACRRMHEAYRRVTIKKMYKLNSGSRPVVRVLVDGHNATFCMGRQRVHEGKNTCRACFTIEERKDKAVMYQECFSPECNLGGRQRYRSNAVDLPERLATQLGFRTRLGRDDSEQAMVAECAERLLAQIRGRKVPPLRGGRATSRPVHR